MTDRPPPHAHKAESPPGVIGPVIKRLLTSLALVVLGTVGGPGCEEASTDDPIVIGLLLSYTGGLAANSVNSERALQLAIEAANEAGGVDGRTFRVMARDTRSDARKVSAPAKELLAAGAAVLIGPDYGDFLTTLRPLLRERTVLLPSLGTAGDIEYKPAPWFVMGPSVWRLACELMGQATADGRGNNVILISSPSSFNSSLSFAITNLYNPPKHVLSMDQTSSPATIRPLSDALGRADAYLLAAAPEAASSLVYALTAIGALENPDRWYLSPSLHTPGFLASIPKGALDGARGVASGTVAGAGDFRARFAQRWGEEAQDDAYAFYDSGAIGVLAVQRAVREEQRIPGGTGLSRHVVAVTRPGGIPVEWSEIGKGLQLLREGREIEYFGLTGQLQFDDVGKTQTVSTKWWSIADDVFVDMPHTTNCK
jgi:neutral amino acid transport system substrate-binding protein